MVDADFSAAQAAEVLFRPIRARAVKAVSFLVIDSLPFEAVMQAIPRSGFVDMNDGPFGDTRAVERSGGALRSEYGGHRVSATPTNVHNHLAITTWFRL
jgi:hypothetical protein